MCGALCDLLAAQFWWPNFAEFTEMFCQNVGFLDYAELF